MNTSLLFEKNIVKQKKPLLLNGTIEYTNNCTNFDINTIKDIIQFVNSVKFYYHSFKGVRIIFNFVNVISFKDKLTYIVFECICYYLIKNFNANILLGMIPKKIISSEGVIDSPLLVLNQEKDYITRNKKYIEKFELQTTPKKYRRLVDVKDESFITVSNDITFFVKNINVDVSTKNKIINALVELIGNSIEHACAKCLIDIDLSDDYVSNNKNDNNTYYALNIAIINFSNINFGDLLNNKMSSSIEFIEQYKDLQDYYLAHEKYFDENYTKEDFFNLSCMQNKISGRKESGIAGGRGLTTFIKALTDLSKESLCYMISGSRLIYLVNKYLKINDMGWIGFNDENDFSLKPYKDLFEKTIVNIPGTAYNFTFVLDKKE